MKDSDSRYMQRKTILILWDASHIWGLMALRAMRKLGLRCRLVRALEIAQSGCLGKRASPDSDILLVPGGNARQKALALGARGLEEIRRWVARGGLYIGVCGGAGLALNGGEDSLRLCPLRRAVFKKRFYHFLSGYVRARLADGSLLSLPIWWPGRFACQRLEEVSVLASYESPDQNLWLADLNLDEAPLELLGEWAASRDVETDLGFPAGEPLVVQGRYGAGSYLLSYSHLETPASPHANTWFASLLGEYAGLSISNSYIPQWTTCADLGPFQKEGNNFQKEIADAHAKIRMLIRPQFKNGLLFKRMPWLMGWQSGFSGMSINNLLACLAYCHENCPASWDRSDWEIYEYLMTDFLDMASRWFWTRRLDMALAQTSDMHMNHPLTRAQIEIFGHPMLGGGLAGKLLDFLEEFVWRWQSL